MQALSDGDRAIKAKQFKTIRIAYETLVDPEKRDRYVEQQQKLRMLREIQRLRRHPRPVRRGENPQQKAYHRLRRQQR